jgi:hypothetical protein
MLNTPVLFLIFNRPDTTAKVFEAIRQAKPKQLFIAADGPRVNRPEDAEKCRQVQEIALKIDWDCEVKTLFRKINLGCGVAPASAITWFFEHVEQGIILEDDCLPNQDFFRFCEELLDYYQHNERIMHISGNNFQNGKRRGSASYYFSKYSHNWGWATWRRAWKFYDFEIGGYNDFKEKRKIKEVVHSLSEEKYWMSIFEELKGGKRDIWDWQWLFSIWAREGVSIIPNVNLVDNIGFNEDATHTTHRRSFPEMSLEALDSSLVHPSKISINVKADIFTFKTLFYSSTSLVNHIRNFCYKNLSTVQVEKLRTLRRRIFPVAN